MSRPFCFLKILALLYFRSLRGVAFLNILIRGNPAYSCKAPLGIIFPGFELLAEVKKHRIPVRRIKGHVQFADL